MYYGQFYFILISFIALAIPSHAKTIFVDDNASEGGNGTSWASAHKYLQDALAGAEYGDEIWVAEGTYKPDQGAGKTLGDRTASFYLVDGVGMYGGFIGSEPSKPSTGDANKTILSGEIDQNSSLWSLHVVRGNQLSLSTILDRFQITKGNANGSDDFGRGGGLFVNKSSLSVNDCIFSNNLAVKGGGMANLGSSANLKNSIFIQNSSESGGAIYLSGFDSKAHISRCIFKENSAKDGGALANDNMAETTLVYSIFHKNSSTLTGGAIVNQYSSLGATLVSENCLFSKNSSSTGGAIYNGQHCPISLTNTTFVRNTAVSGAALSHKYLPIPTIMNSIFWGNISGNIFKSGIQDRFDNLESNWLTKVLVNGIAEQYPGDPNAKEEVYVKKCNILQGWNGDERAINLNPLFSDINDLDGPDDKWFTSDDGLRLQSQSPAIDAGYDSNYSQNYDIAGYLRRQGNSTDIGAYEFGDLKVPIYSVNVISSDASNGIINGAGNYEQGTNATLSAIPALGYLFSNWTGDASGFTNPLTIRISSNKDITARFEKDLRDDDNDSISNYAELVTYKTDPKDSDTDDDSIPDNKEIEIGSNPNISDLAAYNFGKTSVTLNPSSYSLVTQSSFDKGLIDANAQGQANVISNPSNFGLVTKEAYDLLQKKMENEQKNNYPWVSFDDFSVTSINSEKWDLMWWDGAQPPTLSNGMLVLGGKGQLHSPSSQSNAIWNKFIEKNLPAGQNATMHSIAQLKAEGIYGLQAKLMLPSGNAVETGMGMAALRINEDGTRHQFEFEIGYWNENSQSIELEFDYRTPGVEGKKAYYRSGKFDTFYEVSLIRIDGTNSLYFGEELIFEFNATWTPNCFHFFAFNDQDPNWKPFTTYVKDIKVLVPGTPNPVPVTPYTPAWFYLPNQGWLWTNRKSYPYFYDGASKAWMYFQSGNEKPRFYHYGTKTWMTVE